jgi:hypothetical protein
LRVRKGSIIESWFVGTFASVSGSKSGRELRFAGNDLARPFAQQKQRADLVLGPP